jgi:hypothetical protein
MLHTLPHDVALERRPPAKTQRVPLGVISNAVMSAPPDSRRHSPPPVFVHAEIAIGLPSDPQDVTEYEHIIYRSMRERETFFPKSAVEQTEITSHDRDCLVDWMCRLHYKAQVTTESLFRAVGILDRAMELTRMSRHRLQLIGAASLLIASKIKNTSALSVGDAVAIAQHEYSPQNLSLFWQFFCH